MRRLLFVVLFASVVLAPSPGCGRPSGLPAAHCSGALEGGTVPDASVSFPSAESNLGTCPPSPVLLTGSAAAGEACASNTDCAPSCCACVTGGATALLGWCLNGLCASADEACCAFETYPSSPACQGQ